MRKLIIQEFLTLDGVMQAPGGSTEDVDGGFKYGGWQINFPDPGNVGGDFITKAYESADTLLLGRKTFDIFAGFWPTQGKDIPIGKIINSMTKYVASNTKSADTITWEKSSVLKGNIAEEINKIKSQEGKNILVAGSGEFAQTLMKENLIDEYQLMVHPLVLGEGKKLFREGGPNMAFTLSSYKITGSGVAILVYAKK